jgi:hypothetical protein
MGRQETNTMFSRLHDIFKADCGGDLYDHDRRALQEKLTPQISEWLGKLSEEDLTNVCIGEVREDGLLNYGGKWQKIPDDVHAYLEALAESFG